MKVVALLVASTLSAAEDENSMLQAATVAKRQASSESIEGWTGGVSCNECSAGHYIDAFGKFCECGKNEQWGGPFGHAYCVALCTPSASNPVSNCPKDCEYGKQCTRTIPAKVAALNLPTRTCVPGGATYEGTPNCMGAPAKAPFHGSECDTTSIKFTTARDQGGCQACKCEEGKYVCQGAPRFRQEINDWTDEKFQIFADAVNTLKRSGEWDRIAFMHQEAGRLAHGTNIFLHWHRKYLFDLETMVQAAANDCTITIPWWNWAMDNGRQGVTNPKVWGPNRYGKLYIPYNGSNYPAGGPNPIVGHDLTEWSWMKDWLLERFQTWGPGFADYAQNFQGQEVRDGQFGVESAFGEAGELILRNIGSPRTRPTPEVTPGSPVFNETARVIWLAAIETARDDAVMSPRSLPQLRMALNIGDVEQVADISESFRVTRELGTPPGFVQVVEREFHNDQHCVVGAFMCGLQLTAPYDPVFFLHHSMVDQIWKDWQDTHLVEDSTNWSEEHEDMALPLLVCPPLGAEAVSSAAVEVSHDMRGGFVQYVPRFGPTGSSCGEEGQKINCCLKHIADTDKWGQIARIQTDTDATADVCNPSNSADCNFDRIFLQRQVVQKIITQQEADQKLAACEAGRSLLGEVFHDQSTIAEPTDCEKSLCMAVTTGENSILSLCGDRCDGQ